MSAPGYGRVAVAEPPSSLLRLHWHRGGKLGPVCHPPAIPVLDQGDLTDQGIDVAQLVPGAPAGITGLGSCVPNASTAALSAILPEARLTALGIYQAGALIPGQFIGAAVADEEFAIRLYHSLTMLTGQPSSEWPPEDCGSSGLYACQYLEAGGIISGHKIAQGAENIVSLMQQGPLIVGQPYFYAWEEPGSNGFIDGNGTQADLEAAISSGVAGGHETCWFEVADVARDGTGAIDPQRTIIGFRQSWGSSWGQHGNGYAHLSTFIALQSYCDFRLLLA
jgi:hypothetical protein